MAAADILNIWNNAISSIGVKSSIASLTEQSAEAAACALNYPTMIKRFIRETDWNCCRLTVALTDITTTFAPPTRWAYRYSFPANCQRIWRMQNPTGFLWAYPAPLQGFEVAIDLDPASTPVNTPTSYIYSNYTSLSAVIGAYAYDTTNGYYEALFDASMADAASWALAAEVAGALTGNAGIMQNARAEATRSLAEARAASANESSPNSMDVPQAESLSVRGFDIYAGLPYANGLYWPYN